LGQYGIFVVRKGEMETWLSELEIPGKKTDWTLAILDRLGADPHEDGYVGPGEGDVWHFIRNIVVWIKDSARKGTN
jgi:hypothetical protein